MPGVSVLRKASFSHSKSPSCHPLFIKSMAAQNQSINNNFYQKSHEEPAPGVCIPMFLRKEATYAP